MAAANRGKIHVAGSTPIAILLIGGRDLWMRCVLVENLEDSDLTILGVTSSGILM